MSARPLILSLTTRGFRAFKLPFAASYRRAMSSITAPYLLAPRDLQQKLDANNKVAILDVTWLMPNTPRSALEEFQAKRIPGAQRLDLDEVASPNELGLMHMMPSSEIFAKACESFGIDPSTHVILYDTHGVFSAPRALYMFRAFGHTNSSILDGGLPRWEAEGNNVDTAPPQSASVTADYPEPKLNEAVVKSYEQMVDNMTRDPTDDPALSLVVDARPQGRFTGKDAEPRPGLPSGHMPYAFSLPFTSFLQINTNPSTGATYATLLPPSELREALIKAVGKDNAENVLSGQRSIITSCGSGMTAGVLWLGLRLLGVEKIALYDESWTGYAARNSSQVVKDV